MMVPGDLPVFLKIAFEVCSRQNPEHLVEVVVIPDQLSPEFLGYFEKLKRNWTKSPIRLVRLNPVEFLLTKKLNNPHTNNWLQFIRGCNSVSSTHVLWHDSDLFLIEKDFLKKHFEACRDSKYACYGVSEVWDKWYKENGFPYMTSTWELMLDLKWVKKFKPWQHRGHEGFIHDKKHVFDITLLPQCLTPADQIGYQKDFQNFVHLNYVIGQYRHYQNRKGPYEDVGLKLLYIRLLIDMYDDSGCVYDIPSLSELLSGFQNKDSQVTYLDDYRKTDYIEFQTKLLALRDSGLLDQRQKEILENGLAMIDSLFGVYAK